MHVNAGHPYVEVRGDSLRSHSINAHAKQNQPVRAMLSCVLARQTTCHLLTMNRVACQDVLVSNGSQMNDTAYHRKKRRKHHLRVGVEADDARALRHGLYDRALIVAADLAQSREDLVQEWVHVLLQQDQVRAQDLRVVLPNLHLAA
jgi:hypothetical protein